MPVKQVVVMECDACFHERKAYASQACYEGYRGIVICEPCFRHTQTVLNLLGLSEQALQIETTSRKRTSGEVFNEQSQRLADEIGEVDKQ